MISLEQKIENAGALIKQFMNSVANSLEKSFEETSDTELSDALDSFYQLQSELEVSLNDVRSVMLRKHQSNHEILVEEYHRQKEIREKLDESGDHHFPNISVGDKIKYQVAAGRKPGHGWPARDRWEVSNGIVTRVEKEYLCVEPAVGRSRGVHFSFYGSSPTRIYRYQLVECF